LSLSLYTEASIKTSSREGIDPLAAFVFNTDNPDRNKENSTLKPKRKSTIITLGLVTIVAAQLTSCKEETPKPRTSYTQTEKEKEKEEEEEERRGGGGLFIYGGGYRGSSGSGVSSSSGYKSGTSSSSGSSASRSTSTSGSTTRGGFGRSSSASS
jgi:hypothetical protein